MSEQASISTANLKRNDRFFLPTYRFYNLTDSKHTISWSTKQDPKQSKTRSKARLAYFILCIQYCPHMGFGIRCIADVCWGVEDSRHAYMQCISFICVTWKKRNWGDFVTLSRKKHQGYKIRDLEQGIFVIQNRTGYKYFKVFPLGSFIFMTFTF